MFVQNFKHLGSFAYVLTQTIKSNSRYARLATASLHFFFPRPIHDGLYDLLTMRPSCEGMTREYTLETKPHSAELSFDARIPQSSMRPTTQFSIPFAVDLLSKNSRWAKPPEQESRCPRPEANGSKRAERFSITHRLCVEAIAVLNAPSELCAADSHRTLLSVVTCKKNRLIQTLRV